MSMAYYPYYPYQAQYQPTPQNSIIWVSGEQEAQMYPIAPNNAVTLWDRNGGAVYVKSADATGKPTMKTYDLTERVEALPVSQQGNLPDYATKSELAAFNAALEGIRADIETIRADLYGIAGKKKTRKDEEE